MATPTSQVDEPNASVKDASSYGSAWLCAACPPGGRVTAGTSGRICDGAAAVLIASEDAASRLRLETRARFVSFGLSGVDPYRMLHGNPQACAAALATLEEIDRHGLVARSAAMGEVLHAKLNVLRSHPVVGDVRGLAVLAGIEFVRNVATREPSPRAQKFAERFAQAAFDAGLVVWPNTGHANGVDGDLVMLAPPFIVTEKEIDEIVTRGIGDRATVGRVAAMIDRAEYKRRQAAPGVKITPKAFGRDRRLPITNRYVGQ